MEHGSPWEKQEAKIETIKADGKVKDDVRKQEETLAETATMMIPDTHSRLERAVVDMLKLLESKSCGYLGNCEEVVVARSVLNEAQAALRHYHFSVQGGWICYTP